MTGEAVKQTVLRSRDEVLEVEPEWVQDHSQRRETGRESDENGLAIPIE